MQETSMSDTADRTAERGVAPVGHFPRHS